jgi:hypothetical protein
MTHLTDAQILALSLIEALGSQDIQESINLKNALIEIMKQEGFVQ